MHIPKPAAALTSGLLARKGGARPAMRRTPIATLGSSPVHIADDLGWNDMGDEIAPDSSPVATQIASLKESLAKDMEPAQVETSVPKSAEVRQLFETSPLETSPRAQPVLSSGRRSAFTLRIDDERHLRLRLLSAVSNQSAQQLLISALDALIEAHPDIDGIASDPKTRSARNRKAAKK
jgi:hypothetical protein